MQGAEDWSVVVADHQTAGRGRLDRTWFAPPGEALLFSVIVKPTGEPPLVNLAAAVALAEVLAEEGFDVGVKWPNDVLIGGRKVAGILSEVRPTADGDAVIVGVGLNVNVASFPPELESTATSLMIEQGAPADRDRLLEAFLTAFRRWAGAPPERMLAEYVRWCATLGRDVTVTGTTGEKRARAVGIDPSGGLVLDDGEVVMVGDVVHLRDIEDPSG